MIRLRFADQEDDGRGLLQSDKLKNAGVVVSLVEYPRGFRFGPFEVDLETGELRKKGRRIRLQEKPLNVLIALLEKQGKLVNREALRQRLWPTETFVDFDNGLNTAVSKLREALGDTAERPEYVETLARRGYRFVASAEEFGAPLTPKLREVEIQRKRIEPDVVVVEIVGRITVAPECQQIEWLISALLRENESKIILDISGVDRVDSTGVGIIFMCFAKVREAGGELRLAGATGLVEKVLRIATVDTRVRMYDTTAEALKGFTSMAA